MPVSPRLPIDPLLDPDQVALLLDVDPQTVARWAEAGRLDAFDTVAGRRRFAQSDVFRLLVDIRRVQKGAAARAPRTPGGATGKRTQAIATAEADLDVRLTARAVATAAVLASDAATQARLGREIAGREADHLVAEEAARNAVAARVRAVAAAARIRDAAERAAASERSTAAQGDPAMLQRAARMEATVEATAAAVSTETAALAESVAYAVAMNAELVAATRVTLERAIEAEVAATAAAVELTAMAAAHLTAADVGVRLRRPATAR